MEALLFVVGFHGMASAWERSRGPSTPPTYTRQSAAGNAHVGRFHSSDAAVGGTDEARSGRIEARRSKNAAHEYCIELCFMD